MSNKFEEIWKLKPEGLSKVYVYNKEDKIHEEKQIYRSYRSYLNVPPFNEDLPKSYMYDGLEESVPNILLPYVKDAWSEDSRYNQLIVNWYNPEDYIQPHRDCDHYMVDDYKIKIVSINEKASRKMLFQSVANSDNNYTELLREPLYINKFCNTNYRHSVGLGEGRRISLAFRMLDEDKIKEDN